MFLFFTVMFVRNWIHFVFNFKKILLLCQFQGFWPTIIIHYLFVICLSKNIWKSRSNHWILQLSSIINNTLNFEIITKKVRSNKRKRKFQSNFVLSFLIDLNSLDIFNTYVIYHYLLLIHHMIKKFFLKNLVSHRFLFLIDTSLKRFYFLI